MRLSLILIWCAGFVYADPVMDIADAARQSFDEMPAVVRVDQIAGRCGATAAVNSQVVYCTTDNQILVTDAVWETPQAAYLVAHLYGHAVQVRHGIADVALRKIRNRRSEERMLRGLVARQVDCIAGYLVARAGTSNAALTDWLSTEPFAGVHWGRNPLRVGPRVSIGLAERDVWFQIGQEGDLAACAPGEFTADLLIRALRG